MSPEPFPVANEVAMASFLQPQYNADAVCVCFLCFKGALSTLSAPERHVNGHPNQPDPPGPFSPICFCSHALSRRCPLTHLSLVFYFHVSSFHICSQSLQGFIWLLQMSCSFDSGLGVLSPAASSPAGWFSGAPSLALFSEETWKLSKYSIGCDLPILLENLLCWSQQKQLVCGLVRFCATSSPSHQVTAPGQPPSLSPQSNHSVRHLRFQGVGRWQQAALGQFAMLLL